MVQEKQSAGLTGIISPIARGPTTARDHPSSTRPKMPVDLSEAIAVTMRFGHLLDLPEHPHKGYAQADDDAQEQQRQGRGCEHGEHP
jgi:hypothetical protein